MRFRLVFDLVELEKIACQWDVLVSQSEFSDVFLLYGFARAWWRAYGQNGGLKIVIGEDENKVRIIAPFYSVEAEPKQWRLIGDVRADYNNIIYAKDDKEAIVGLLQWLFKIYDWKQIEFRKIPSVSQWVSLIPNSYTSYTDKKDKIISWLNVSCPIAYRSAHEQHYYLDQKHISLNSALLESPNYRKHMNWFNKNGRISFLTITKTETIHSYLALFINMHIVEWSGKEKISLFINQKNRNFYAYLVEEMGRYRDALQVDISFLGDDLLAMHLGFVWNNRQYYYKPCYNSAYSAHSPGKILLAYIIQKSSERKLNEFDFLLGGEAYKNKFSPLARQTNSGLIYHSRWYAIQDRLKALGFIKYS